MIIKKVRKMGTQKIITIPKNSDIKLGDHVEIIRINSVAATNKIEENNA